MALYSLRELIESASSVSKQAPDNSWIPARPENWKYLSFWERLRHAWAVMVGELDVVKWPEQKSDWYPSPFPKQEIEPVDQEFFGSFNRLVESQQKLEVISQALSDYSLSRAQAPDLPPHKRAGKTRTINALIREVLRYSNRVRTELEDMVIEFSSENPPELPNRVPALPPALQLVESSLLTLQADLALLNTEEENAKEKSLPDSFWDSATLVLQKSTSFLSNATRCDSSATLHDSSLRGELEALIKSSHSYLRSLRSQKLRRALYMTQVVSSLSRLDTALENHRTA